MPYKVFPNFGAAQKNAEAVGRLYAQSIGRTWPIPPESYGPGRQPEPREAYYQKYWVAAQDDLPADPPNGVPAHLPVRIYVDDPFTPTTNGAVVTITGGEQVTLNWNGLVNSAVQVGAAKVGP